MQLRTVILSGGSGTRLWPLSREKYPKQLLKLFGDNSMLQSTALRLKYLDVGVEVNLEPIVICNQEYRFITAEQLREAGLANASIILEPVGRNTAPAMTAVALQAAKENGDALLLMMPADHLIADIKAFHQAIAAGVSKALSGSIVCFGIKPKSPETGYGYIKTVDGANEVVKQLHSFVEKPDVELAKSYLDDGSYVWNSGIFLCKASVWLDAIAKLNPEIYTASSAAYSNARFDKDFIWLDEDLFSACPENSIDYAVMEHTGVDNENGLSAFVVPMDTGWSDVGAWDAVWSASEKDSEGNVKRGTGNAIFHGSKNSLAHAARKRLVAVLGMEDVIVVDTQDAVLVAHKESLPELKKLIAKVKGEHIHLTEHWRQVFRPWGSYDSIDSGENFQVKRIIVNPGQVLSLQMHHHRAEHWIVVKGTGKITKGDEVFLLSENESTYIPLGVTHRLENPGKIPLELIEVQSGSYLGEDDIVRFVDVYGRVGS
jgi:mannose-1-phosphate guanylyltransferase / mannose-6-phosphate isomerase